MSVVLTTADSLFDTGHSSEVLNFYFIQLQQNWPHSSDTCCTLEGTII